MQNNDWRNENDWGCLANSVSQYKINTKIKENLKDIEKQIGHCVITFKTWERLFSESEERVNDMNHVSPAFFHVIQSIMIENVALNTCNLMDPYSQGRYTNFSLYMLIHELRSDGAPSCLVTLLETTLDELTSSSSATKLRMLRNKLLAHFDEIEKVKAIESNKMPYSVENVKEVVDDIVLWTRFLEFVSERNYVQVSYGESTLLQLDGLFDLLGSHRG